MLSQTDLKMENVKSQSSPAKASNAQSASDDERKSVASDHSNQDNQMSQLEKKSTKLPQKNDDACEGNAHQDKEKEIEEKDDSSLMKSPTSPEKQGIGMKRYP